MISSEELEARLDRSDNGNTIYKLATPVNWKGDSEYNRCTIPSIKGKHLRNSPFRTDGESTIGDLITFAAHVVQPIGIVDEMTPEDALAVSIAVMNQFSKFQATGQ